MITLLHAFPYMVRLNLDYKQYQNAVFVFSLALMEILHRCQAPAFSVLIYKDEKPNVLLHVVFSAVLWIFWLFFFSFFFFMGGMGVRF